MKPFKLSGNFWTVLVVAIFFGSVVYLSQTQPSIVQVFTVAMLPFVIGIIGGIQRSEAAVQQSAANNVKIAQIDEKVDGNTEVTETTHKIVNSRMDEFRQALADVAALKEQQAFALAEMVAAKAELKIANERAEGITIGRAQVSATIDAVRSGDSTPTVEAPILVVAPKAKP